MFNLSMPELALIGVVALLVLGPERLPGAARTAGALLRRAQRSWSGLKSDIERELAADELKRELEQGRKALRDDEAMASLARLRDDLAGRTSDGGDPKPAPTRPDDTP